MMKIKSLLKKLFAITILLCANFSAFTQQESPVEMAEGLRSSGKIYIVVAVLCIIFLGIISYLVVIDRKVRKLEKESKK